VTKMILAALALAVMAGCASTSPQGVQVAAAEERYTPLGTLLPRKKTQSKDERAYIDKEEFKRQQESVGAFQGKAN